MSSQISIPVIGGFTQMLKTS